MRRFVQVTILFLITLSSLIFTIPMPVYACSCAAPAPVKEALAQADAVFAGKVTEIVKPRPNVLGVISSADPVDVTFDVSQIWKGIETKRVTIVTALSSASCGFAFDMGKEYIVYSYKNQDNFLETNICTRTQELTAASEDLASLGTGITPIQNEQPSTKENAPYLWISGILVLVGVTYFFVKKR
ncbi:hypothetical protein ACFLFF_00430 [Brevibacillus reuszeri]|uniref:hypothetical protein n=1 Tax=Brevibacillus reuszeri TaxID=54915 RepID=UPI00366ED564